MAKKRGAKAKARKRKAEEEEEEDVEAEDGTVEVDEDTASEKKVTKKKSGAKADKDAGKKKLRKKTKAKEAASDEEGSEEDASAGMQESEEEQEEEETAEAMEAEEVEEPVDGVEVAEREEEEEEEKEVPAGEGDVTRLEDVVDFAAMGLDPRLLKAIAKQEFNKPTLVQSAAIPLALSGRDILARARTGSGKTAAFAIPIVQLLLASTATPTAPAASSSASSGAPDLGIKALVLVPTAELCKQAWDVFKQFTAYCSDRVSATYITRSMTPAIQQKRLAELPDVLISTPALVLSHLQQQHVELQRSLRFLVVDEADLLMSFGYHDDVKVIAAQYLPASSIQSFLMSATLSTQVEQLKQLILTRPAVLRLQDTQTSVKEKLEQFSIKCPFVDKFLLIFALVKLKMIKGKALFFVNSIDRCYRLKLFFERCGIRAAVLNSELPQNSRVHLLEQFNRSVFQFLIASDESMLTSKKSAKKKRSSATSESEGSGEGQEGGQDAEYGVARGVDFKGVKYVINFDFPLSVKSYVHRIGRTARGGASGQAISIVSKDDEKMLDSVAEHVAEQGNELKQFGFDLELLRGFRYRVEDLEKSITPKSIRMARLDEIHREVLNSQKLQSHFEDNPRDLSLLNHAAALQPGKAKEHWKSVPDYLVPSGVKQPKLAAMPQKTKSKKRKRRVDPLKSFVYAKTEDKGAGDAKDKDAPSSKRKKTS